MAYNWLMMTSSGDDNRPSGSLGLNVVLKRFWIKKRCWIHADQLLVITNQNRDVNIRYFKIMNNCIRSYTL